MEAHTILSSLLDCGYLDADFLIRLIDAYDLDLSDILDDVESYLGTTRPNINHLIYSAYECIAHDFLEHTVK